MFTEQISSILSDQTGRYLPYLSPTFPLPLPYLSPISSLSLPYISSILSDQTGAHSLHNHPALSLALSPA